jgi:hypothetical protein
LPGEQNRVTKKKIVQLPDGSTVGVAVITQISFIDPIDRYQETEFTVDNSGQADRDVHIDTVTASDGSSGSIDVERIDLWRVLDPIERSQETFFAPDNKTGADSKPPHFSTHQKTHVIRFTDSPGDPIASWVETELIDEFDFQDAVDRGQETLYTLLNPPSNTVDGVTDNGDGTFTATGDDDGSDSPVRTDPFQNIVDFSAAKPFFNIFMSGISHWASTGAPSDTGVPTQNPDGSANPPPGAPLVVPIPYAFNNTWLADFSYTTISSGVLHNQGFGAGPSVSGDRSVSKGMLQYVGTGINGGFFNTPDTSGVGGNASPQATISGPPLVVGGNVIAGFVGTLSFTVTVYAIQTNEVSGDSALIWPNGTSHTWLSYHGGNYVNSPSTTVAIDTFTITVSSSPFRFTAGTFTGMFKAVGLSDNGGQVWTGGSLSVYCIFIGP